MTRVYKWTVFVVLLVVSVLGIVIYSMDQHQRLEDSFPASITIAKENQVMTPEELLASRRLGMQKENQKSLRAGDDAEETKEPAVDSSIAKYKDSQKFQMVKENELYVFSAYLDNGMVRIPGYRLRQSFKENPNCQFLLDEIPGSETKSPIVEGWIENIPEHHGRRFTACFVCCKISGVKEESILAVKVTPPQGSTNAGGVGEAILPIQQSLDRVEKRDWKSEFSLCVAPIEKQYNKVHTLVEMIEFNRILGADKFFFYNYSIGADVEKVLEFYKDKNVVEMIDWKIPLMVGPDEIDPDIHYYGQLIAHNDCLYRNRGHSKYVVIQDIDEFVLSIMPAVSTWKELIQYRKKVRPRAAIFQFKNCFFPQEWSAKSGDLDKFDFTDKISKFKSVVLSSVYREDKFFKHGHRSKCIVDPTAVVTLGIHNIWKKTGEMDRVPESEAFLHHFRKRFKSSNNSMARVFDDLVLTKYGTKLVEALKKAWEELKKSKGLAVESISS